MRKPIFTGVVAVAASLALVPLAIADSTGLGNSNAAASASYWTPERYASAKPYPLPNPTGPVSQEAQAAPSGPSHSAPGQPPTVKVAPNYANVLFVPRAAGVEPQAFGTSGGLFTSARLSPNAAAIHDTKYPNSVNGQLFFSDDGSNFVCSGTVGRFRIVFTAGHCVSDGRGHFHSGRNWRFVPSIRGGVGPFGTFNWVFVTVDNRWHFGGGGVPNAGDNAWLEFADKGGARIGSITGFSGFFTGAFSNHVTAIGYPCNLDNCSIMHRNDAQAFRFTSPNSVEIGSDMRGGASGGGWFENYGEAAAGQNTACTQFNCRNAWIASTSYGPISTSPQYLGASRPDGTWFNILNGSNVCGRRAGNC
ncbi:MAG TPA: hypothetical protein VGW35_22915 [Methylomirabilota bacterium]|nr:hypothetical protein [Methylomirabilota bacterium]